MEIIGYPSDVYNYFLSHRYDSFRIEYTFEELPNELLPNKWVVVPRDETMTVLSNDYGDRVASFTVRTSKATRVAVRITGVGGINVLPFSRFDVNKSNADWYIRGPVSSADDTRLDWSTYFNEMIYAPQTGDSYGYWESFIEGYGLFP